MFDVCAILDSNKAALARNNLLAPRKMGPDGHEDFDQKVVKKVVCEEITIVEDDNPFDRHWRTPCEYEQLPMVYLNLTR